MNDVKKLNYLGSFIFFLVLSIFCSGQIAVGQWRDHLPYNYGEMIAISGDDVYLLTNVGLLKYSTVTGETEKLSKINGLSDSGVKSIGFSQHTGYLVLGYSNGNVDLIRDGEVINVGDIKRKLINGDKAIYCIDFKGTKAYLGLGFGVVVIDLINLEVIETWYVGENGGNLKVNAIDIKGDYVYLATDEGVLKGNINNALVDFSKWEILTDEYVSTSTSWMSGKSYDNLHFINGNLLVNYNAPDINNADTIMIFDGAQWNHFNPDFNDVEYLGGNDNEFYLSVGYWIKIFDADLNEVRHIWKLNFEDEGIVPRAEFIMSDGDNGLWIADRFCGLVHNTNLWYYDKIEINGPKEYSIFDMDAVNSKIVGVAGGMNLSWGPNWDKAMYYEFSDQMWDSYDYKIHADFADYRDFVCVKIDPNDPDRYFLGSWVYGLVEMRNNELYKYYDETNSSLEPMASIAYLRIGGLDFDEEGNLWVTNSLSTPQFHVLTTENEWYGIDYSVVGGINIGKIIVTQNNHKWAILPQGVGLFAFDENGTYTTKSDDRYKKLSVINEDGEIVSNEVYSIAEDKDGYIWVGTNKGVVVYYNPEDVFESGTLNGNQVKIPRNDGTDNADILLANEIVTSIVVDGANRKWFGTQTGGVYYTSEDGIEEIHHFTTENSPILDNNILTMDIVPETGEVFFGTASGIISYRNTATEPSDDYNGVYAFPNPVEPDYTGPITISGLVAGSYVKITDISGNIVYETRSEGGSAVWYGKNMNGEKVHTGVYLVFSTNETGSKTDITKILFIN